LGRLESAGKPHHVTTAAHDKATRNQRIHRAIRIREYALKQLSEPLYPHYSTISVIAKQVEIGLKG